MNIIFKIAKNELRNLFYSPVAWFVMIVFLATCAYFFGTPWHRFAFLQDLFQKTKTFIGFGPTLTSDTFMSGDGLFANMYQYLFLFLPLLTMGLLSKEINNGTHKLLYASPIKMHHIVLGKYLGIMLYNLLLLGIVSIFVMTGVFTITLVDVGHLSAAMLGLFLIMASYSAIGIFMSSLSNYQIVSGIATFLVLLVLNRIGSLWQQYDFIRDITWSLSMAGRSQKMLAGLITSRDVGYFIIISFLFLSFTVFRLRAQREKRPWGIHFLQYTSVTLITLAVGYIISRPSLIAYWDTTASQTNTIHPRIQKQLKEIGKDTLEVTLYTNLFGENSALGFPQNRNAGYLASFWEQYQRFKPDIQFKYVYYYYNGSEGRDTANINAEQALFKDFPGKTEKQIAGIIARLSKIDSTLFIGPEEIRRQIDPYKEGGRLYMALKYKNKTAHLRSYVDTEPLPWPGQKEVAVKLKQLLTGDFTKAYVLTGNLERSIFKTGEREYSSHTIFKNNRKALINLGFEFDTLSLEKQHIPTDSKILVIADPKRALPPLTLTKINNYIAQGGNLLILGEPGKQAILNPVLQQLGIRQLEGQLVQLDKNETPEKIIQATNHGIAEISEKYKNYQTDKFEEGVLAIPGKRMVGATALSATSSSNFTIKSLFGTVRNPDLIWNKIGKLVIDSVPPTYHPENGDTKQPSFNTLAMLSRKLNGKQQRIIVSGDADLLSNVEVHLNPEYEDLYSWLDDDKYPVYLPETSLINSKLTISEPNAKKVKILYLWILPFLMLAASIILSIRRKRK